MGELVKGQIGKEDMEVQFNTNASETFTRTSSTGGTLSLTKIPDIWGGSGKIKVAQIEGDLTGDVTGDVTGNLTGNVTGNLTGSITGCTGLLTDDQHVLDAEAIAAAQTIKLDDFASPDDNTDLNVSTTKHGLAPKGTVGTTSFWRQDWTLAVPSSEIGSYPITIFPWMYNSVVAGTWVAVIDTGCLHTGRFRNNTTHNDGDGLDFKVTLSAGTYTLKIMGTKNTNLGISDILIDGVEVASFNWNDVVTPNVINAQANIVVATSGIKTLRIIIDGTTGTDHVLDLQEITLYRTA